MSTLLTSKDLKGYNRIEIEEFDLYILSYGFSPKGLSTFIELCNMARFDRSLSTYEIKKLADFYGQKEWYNQHPTERANPDAPGDDGLINQGIWQMIYSALRLPIPEKFQIKV